MFYSHTYLSRKSALGTVWIAAHLQRKIKKSQIDEIKIPEYADRIMFPDVPIALRLTAHLLLGLVRIYSWKVNYLFQDCNRMVTDIRTLFLVKDVDLPIDANHATFETVTMPDNFDLDAVEIDESYLTNGPDKHRVSLDDITLQDETRVEREGYVTIIMNEDDDRINTTISPANMNFDSVAMDKDTFPPFEGNLEDLVGPSINVADTRDPGPSNQTGLNEGTFADEFPETEVMRDAVNNTGTDNLSLLDDMLLDAGLLEKSAPTTNRNDNLSPIMEEPSASKSLPVPNDPPSTNALPDELDTVLNTGMSTGQQIPDIQLQPSPVVQQENAKKRKRKAQGNILDLDTIVLKNDEMKELIADASKLVCKRKKLPDTALSLWRYRKGKETMFTEPLFTGLGDTLRELYNRNYLVTIEPENVTEPAVANTETEPAPQDIEVENLRSVVNDDVALTDILPSPSRLNEQTTPLNASNNVGSVSDKGNNTTETVVPPTGTTVPELGTPPVDLGEQLNFDDSNAREFPSLISSANATNANYEDDEELGFLEATNEVSVSSSVSVQNMSERTRAFAQFLKSRSPTSQASEDHSGSLNLNKLLEKKTRKICARTFFETLVLNTFDYVDVKQEEAYGDILITPTPALSSTKFA